MADYTEKVDSYMLEDKAHWTFLVRDVIKYFQK